MIVVPEQHTWKRHGFAQLFERDLGTERPHANAVGSICQAQHAYTFTGDEAMFTEMLNGVFPSVIPGNGAQAGWAAVHGVGLEHGLNGMFGHLGYRGCLVLLSLIVKCSMA